MTRFFRSKDLFYPPVIAVPRGHMPRAVTLSSLTAPLRALTVSFRAITVGTALAMSLSGCSLIGNLSDSLFGLSPEEHASKNTSEQGTASSGEPLPGGNSGTPQRSLNSVDSIAPSNLAPSEAGPALAEASMAQPGVELTWKVPEAPTPAFVIYFGPEPNQLSTRREVATARLETVDDRDAGKVYRYVLSNIPTNDPLYVAIAAFDGENESERSEILEVTPQ